MSGTCRVHGDSLRDLLLNGTLVFKWILRRVVPVVSVVLEPFIIS